MKRNKKVMVSGCFDLLRTGHVAFFETAASYGDVYFIFAGKTGCPAREFG